MAGRETTNFNKITDGRKRTINFNKIIDGRKRPHQLN
jgi:hypothetical protein